MSVVSARLRNGIHPRGVEAKTTLTQVKLLVVHEDRDGGKGQQVRDEHDKGKRAERWRAVGKRCVACGDAVED
jgi:hypothetical protein